MVENTSQAPIILASASKTRSHLLTAAGIYHEIVPANVDEPTIKSDLISEGVGPALISEFLADAKAKKISVSQPDSLVLGADQILECEGFLFDKPTDAASARIQLLNLRGKTHRLWTSAVVARAGTRLWHQTETAELKMRNFSDSFLDQYMALEGDNILSCVGGYRLEGRGAQLFSGVSADYFTILGLPLLPLLRFLRANDIIGK